MSRPTRYLSRMIFFVIAVLVIAAMLSSGLIRAFEANPGLNGIILAATVVGMGYTFRSVLTLRPEIGWLDAAQSRLAGHGPMVEPPEPRLLAPMARMIGERRGELVMSAMSMRSMLDGIAARLNETREISRYTIGLLIFLGLLGTFWGLLQTISSVGDVIAGLTFGSTERLPSAQVNHLSIVFEELKEGLEAPLSGMGTAFSSSLFGLGGSLALGFLELQASQAQNRFYNELEDWLSGAAQLTGGTTAEGGEAVPHAPPAYLFALADRTTENLDEIQRTIASTQHSQQHLTQALAGVAEQLGVLNDHMRTQQSVMVRVAESQLDLRPLMQRLVEIASAEGFGIDEATRQHIRHLEAHVSRLGSELAAQHNDTVNEMRAEIRLLARTIATLAGEAEE